MAPKKKGAKEKGKKQGKGAKSGKQSHVLAYGDDTYWNNRYTANPVVFDWYQKYEGVKAFINMYIPKATRVLVIGCGNSSVCLYTFTYFVLTFVDVEIQFPSYQLLRNKSVLSQMLLLKSLKTRMI
jgi:hypothetical protein